MGRPKKIDKRDHQLNISLTGEEFKAIGSRAWAIGLQPVDYARCTLFGEHEARSHPVLLPSRFDRIAVVQLQRLGNLLNQLVRGFHQSGQSAPDELAPLLRDIRRVLERSGT